MAALGVCKHTQGVHVHPQHDAGREALLHSRPAVRCSHLSPACMLPCAHPLQPSCRRCIFTSAAPSPPPAPSGAAGTAAAAPRQEDRYKALLAILRALHPPGSSPGSPSPQLSRFLASQPLATSIPFISWLADLEAAATGPSKDMLASLCELLVVAREASDAAGQEALYAATLKALTAGQPRDTAALAVRDPQRYALGLAEALTGQAPVMEGYSEAVDVLLAVAPAAALTPEAVARGHKLAAELGADLAARRRRSAAAVINTQQRLTSAQEAALLAGTPAARILDLLMGLGSREERLALLPDCFTPPAAADRAAGPAAAQGAGGGTSSTSGRDTAAAAAAAEEEEEETEELWCTPLQLLNEVDSRLKALRAPGDNSSSSSGWLVAGPVDGSSSQEADTSTRYLLPGAIAGSSSSSSGGEEGVKDASGSQQQQEQQWNSQQERWRATAASWGNMSAEQQQQQQQEGQQDAAGPEGYAAALQELRQHIQQQWLDRLPQ